MEKNQTFGVLGSVLRVMIAEKQGKEYFLLPKGLYAELNWRSARLRDIFNNMSQASTGEIRQLLEYFQLDAEAFTDRWLKAEIANKDRILAQRSNLSDYDPDHATPPE